jgi:hypothetical protein
MSHNKEDYKTRIKRLARMVHSSADIPTLDQLIALNSEVRVLNDYIADDLLNINAPSLSDSGDYDPPPSSLDHSRLAQKPSHTHLSHSTAQPSISFDLLSFNTPPPSNQFSILPFHNPVPVPKPKQNIIPFDFDLSDPIPHTPPPKSLPTPAGPVRKQRDPSNKEIYQQQLRHNMMTELSRFDINNATLDEYRSMIQHVMMFLEQTMGKNSDVYVSAEDLLFNLSAYSINELKNRLSALIDIATSI